jgi:uncharacterized protein with HEPN domain
MSQHNTSVSLRHMLDHALEAVAMVKGKTRADLDILWQIVNQDLPSLIESLRKALGEEF